MPYASMIGVVTAIGALIPIIGAILGAGIGVIIIFAVSPIQAGMFLIFIIIFQQLDNRITYPLVVGKSIGLPSVWVFCRCYYWWRNLRYFRNDVYRTVIRCYL